MADQIDPFLSELAKADEGEKLAPADLKALVKLGNHLAALEGTLSRLEQEAKDIKSELNSLALERIPQMMKDIGVRSVGLSDGRNLELSTDLKVSLPKARADQVMDYVRKEGGEDIIKQVVTIDAGRGKSNAVSSILEEAKALGLEASESETIAPPTYAKWIRDRVKANKETDLGLLGAFQFERVNLK